MTPIAVFTIPDVVSGGNCQVVASEFKKDLSCLESSVTGSDIRGASQAGIEDRTIP
jgi:hypothetical protein